jgi:hypothetical protein
VADGEFFLHHDDADGVNSFGSAARLARARNGFYETNRAEEFAAALQQVTRDPDLAAWFSRERPLDFATSDALCSVPVPRDLRATILAGVKISRRRFWSNRPALFAMAASLVLLAGIGSLWTRQSRLDRWQSDALAVISSFGLDQPRFDHEGADSRDLQRWLEAHNAPVATTIPVALQSLPTLGCKTIASGSKTVSIMCFRMQDGELIHLIVSDTSHLNRLPPQQPRFVRKNEWLTASWNENGRVCMLATKGSEQALRALLTKTAQGTSRVTC